MEISDHLLNLYNTKNRGVFYALYPLLPSEIRKAETGKGRDSLQNVCVEFCSTQWKDKLST